MTLPEPARSGGLHHVEVWVPDLAAAVSSWGWLLGELGWQPYQHWDAGRSWLRDGTYLVLEQSPALFPDRHPNAGGPDVYAAYLADTQGYEVELVARWP